MAEGSIKNQKDTVLKPSATNPFVNRWQKVGSRANPDATVDPNPSGDLSGVEVKSSSPLVDKVNKILSTTPQQSSELVDIYLENMDNIIDDANNGEFGSEFEQSMVYAGSLEEPPEYDSHSEFIASRDLDLDRKIEYLNSEFESIYEFDDPSPGMDMNFTELYSAISNAQDWRMRAFAANSISDWAEGREEEFSPIAQRLKGDDNELVRAYYVQSSNDYSGLEDDPSDVVQRAISYAKGDGSSRLSSIEGYENMPENYEDYHKDKKRYSYSFSDKRVTIHR